MDRRAGLAVEHGEDDVVEVSSGPGELGGERRGDDIGIVSEDATAPRALTLAPMSMLRPPGDRYPPASMIAMVSVAMARRLSLTFSLWPSSHAAALQFLPRWLLGCGAPVPLCTRLSRHPPRSQQSCQRVCARRCRENTFSLLETAGGPAAEMRAS